MNYRINNWDMGEGDGNGEAYGKQGIFVGDGDTPSPWGMRTTVPLGKLYRLRNSSLAVMNRWADLDAYDY